MRSRQSLELIIVIIVFFVSCSKNNNFEHKENSKVKVIFTNELILDSIASSFIYDYFDDVNLDDCNYFFLTIYKNTDSTYIKINRIPADFGFDEIKPLGLIKFKKKNIFILNNFRIFHNENSEVIKCYKQSCEEIGKEFSQISFDKTWLLIIENYSNFYRIVRNQNEINQILPFPKSNKSPIQFKVNGNDVEIILNDSNDIKHW